MVQRSELMDFAPFSFHEGIGTPAGAERSREHSALARQFLLGGPANSRTSFRARNTLYGHRPKYREYNLVMGVTRFLQDPPDNYQGVPVFSHYHIFVTLFWTAPI